MTDPQSALNKYQLLFRGSMKTGADKITGQKSHEDVKTHLCHLLVGVTLGLEQTFLTISSNKNDFLHAPFVYNCLSDHTRC